jgi:hypothetical protein
VAEEGVTVSSDGYLICAPAWRRDVGFVYEATGEGEPAPLPLELYDQLVEQGAQTRRRLVREYAAGATIPEGRRHETLFNRALMMKGFSLQRLKGNVYECDPVVRFPFQPRVRPSISG